MAAGPAAFAPEPGGASPGGTRKREWIDGHGCGVYQFNESMQARRSQPLRHTWVARHTRQVIFQMTEVAVSVELLQEILGGCDCHTGTGLMSTERNSEIVYGRKDCVSD